MLKRKQQLLISQLEEKMKQFDQAAKAPVPSGGWIYAVRTALGMSLRQLAARLKMTPQGVKQMEGREQEGTITLNSLREVAGAMKMKLVYALVAENSSIEEMINKRANELAEEIVQRTSVSMKLEDQENTAERIKKAIAERAEELKNENRRLLWN
jgi:predicted DNA-binding mobile mystery protein A